MQELEITRKRVLSIWWLIVWRTLVGATLLGGAAGFILGFIISFLRLGDWRNFDLIESIIPLFVYPITIIWGVVVIKMAIHKHYHDFRLVMVPRIEDHEMIEHLRQRLDQLERKQGEA